MANIVTKNAEWRRRIERVVNIFEICDVNPFAPVAIQAAYNESEDWIDALNLYIHDNFEVLRSFCREHLPKWQAQRGHLSRMGGHQPNGIERRLPGTEDHGAGARQGQ